MFKKICQKCENKINKSFDFCPYCGFNLKSDEDREDYGILGKSDMIQEDVINPTQGSPFMEKIFNQTMKMLEKQMRMMNEEVNDQNKVNRPNDNMPIRNNIQFFVNGKQVFPSNVQNIKKTVEPQKIKVREISKENLVRLSRLPKKEPNSKVRRIGAKIVYELEVPGVNDINDVLVSKLENSIEIKALSETLVYSKILNVNLPILRYALDNGNIILELQGK